ncbi:exo-alpha-sialidase, partial [bacterium]|nr:exo-alpha-sialidase [bacterium]
MKLIPSRPVTIHQVRYGELWFPFLFRLPDGRLELSIEYGHDAHWAPNKRMESIDNGRTWSAPVDPVPRVAWLHGFADGEMFELDTYGIQDPKAQDEAVYFGAWSFPGRPGDVPQKGFVRVEAPQTRPSCLTDLRGYPTHHWWSLWNTLHGTGQLQGPEVFLNGPYFTDGIETDNGRLLALGYWLDHQLNKSCTWLYQSQDRGHTWELVSRLTDPDPKATITNEATLVRLKDGRLYSVLRTEGPLVHTWSADDGRSWTSPVPMKLVDSNHVPAHVWPVAKVLADGTLALVYGRPGKHLIIDPTGTGTGWRSRLDLHQHELDCQAAGGVPADQRLRGVGPDINQQ